MSVIQVQPSDVADCFRRCGTDKLPHGYADFYGTIDRNISWILEIGVLYGASLMAWLELFPEAHVFGVDPIINERVNEAVATNPRVTLIQTNIGDLVVEGMGLPPFDLIVDDGSHEAGDIFVGWNKLKSFLRGTYVVEDVREENVLPLRAVLGVEFSEVVTGKGFDDRLLVRVG